MESTTRMNKDMPYAIVNIEGRYVLFIIDPSKPKLMQAFSSANRFACTEEMYRLSDGCVEKPYDELLILAGEPK